MLNLYVCLETVEKKRAIVRSIGAPSWMEGRGLSFRRDESEVSVE